MFAYIFLILITTAMVICCALCFVILNLNASLWFQLCYTYLFNRRAFDAYRRIKREGCVYYASYEEWISSPTCGTGNEVVFLKIGCGVYTEDKLVLSDIFDKMVNDLIEKSKRYIPENN